MRVKDAADALTHLHQTYILMHMRTTLNIDDRLLEEAARLSGIEEKTAVVRAGLEALIARQSARRLAALGGTERGLRAIPRRRLSVRSKRA
jgi:Arc/MetJ family transcription regulator